MGPDPQRRDRSLVRVSVLAIAVAVLGTMAAVATILAGDDMAPGAAIARGGAETSRFEIRSAAVGESLPVEVVEPRGGGGDRPLVVFLHGREQDERSFLDERGLFDGLETTGERAPVFAFPYGGESSYWHDRDDGDWSAYVTAEVIPEVERRFGTDPSRVAIGGISMGGFGAYEIASSEPEEFCAVGGHSPAIWDSFEASADGAFDDAEDFAAHDLLSAAAADPARFAGDARFWVDIGDADPLKPGADALASALDASGRLERRTAPGGHEAAYWSENWARYVGFYADALSACSSEQRG